jgi:hypothetical protein
MGYRGDFVSVKYCWAAEMELGGRKKGERKSTVFSYNVRS